MSDPQTSAIDPSPAQAIRTPVLLRLEEALAEAQQREIARQDASAFALVSDPGQRFAVAQIIGRNMLNYSAYSDEFKNVPSELYAEVSSAALERNALRQVQGDSEGLQSLSRNTLLRDEASNLVDLHLESLSRIRNPDARYQAALAMGEIAQNHDSYSAELLRQSPSVVAEVQAATSENARRVADKEDRKALDRDSMQPTPLSNLPAPPEVRGPLTEPSLPQPDGAAASTVGVNPPPASAAHQDASQEQAAPALSPAADMASAKVIWRGEWELHEDGLNAIRPVVAVVGEPPMYRGGSQESIRGVEKFPVWDKEPLVTEALARKRATVAANKWIEENRSYTQPPATASSQQSRSTIEGVETVAVKSSELDAALARLKLQYLLANNKYYLRDDTKTLAFEDTGKRLVTSYESAEIVRSMVDLANAKGWSAIKATGSDTFRRKVWLEAALVGVATQGYTPDAFDLDALQKRRAVLDADLVDGRTNSISQADSIDVTNSGAQPLATTVTETQPNDPAATAGNDLAERYGSRLAREVSQALADAGFAPGTRESIASLSYIAELASSPRSFVGKLVEHGPAPYEFKEGATASYYAKLQTRTGMKTVWGVDIPRALTESLGERIQVGDQVLLAFQGSKPVTVKDELTGDPISTHRNTWYTEKISELPTVAAHSAEKPSYSTIPPASSDTHSNAPTARERVLIDVLQGKGAPEGAIAAVRAGLSGGPKPSLAPQLQPTIPVAPASLPIRPTV